MRQPPIDGASGRVYIAGDGFDALDEGFSVWSISPGKRVRATAFGDGGVALTRGDTLQIRDRGGSILVTVTTPDADELVTPPAIASDGSIWVASRTTLYVAR